jgi:tetratricopeptide (TPR) repeat protein
MKDFYGTQEKLLIDELDLLSDPIKKIDRIISFIVHVRSTLNSGVEEWIKKYLPLCRDVNYEKGLFSLYTHLAFFYLMNSNYSLGKSYLDKAGQLDWSQFVHSSEHMYNYHAHGLYCHFMGDKELAMDYFIKSHELARALKNLDFSCQMLNNISLYHLKNKDYPNAERTLLEAFSLINPNINPIPAIKIMDNLGQLYLMTDDYDRSLDYLNSALSYAREKKIDFMLPSLYMSFGMAFEKQNKTAEAEEYLNRACELNGDTFFSHEIPIEYIKFLFSHNKQEQARELAEKTINLFREKGMTGSLDEVYHLIDEYDI